MKYNNDDYNFNNSNNITMVLGEIITTTFLIGLHLMKINSNVPNINDRNNYDNGYKNINNKYVMTYGIIFKTSIITVNMMV